jgi:N-sulfoglucosamine sulfohydrolase
MLPSCLDDHCNMQNQIIGSVMRRALIGVLALTLGCASWTVAADTSRPNIVLFLADDLGWADCSLYGDSGIPTPNMERLARDGMTFSHAFVASPSCAPSRAALLTGLSPARNGAMFNHTLPDPHHKRWPAWFQGLGYEVAAIGKVAHYATVQQYGFDHVSHFGYHEDSCIDAAVKWLENRSSHKPLCLLVGTNWPHVPWPENANAQSTAQRLPQTLVDTPQTREWWARYAEAVKLADRDLGRVYDAAQRLLPSNTLFLFTSDHGAQFPFGKWNCYDAGIRTPLVAVWPSKVAAGVKTHSLVSWVDLLPTCLEAAGAPPPPAGEGLGQLDGQSFLHVLRGERQEHRDRIFTTHSGDGAMNEYPIRSVRTRDWKYIRNLASEAEHHTHIDLAKPVDGRSYWDSWVAKAATDAAAAAIVDRYRKRPAEELYDLAADPWERRNLAADPEHARRLTDLRADLDHWMVAQGDQGLATERARKPKPRADAKTSATPRPDIFVVLADDFGWGDVGCYSGAASTPELDRMAREGTRFTQFYVAAPICSPSRAGLITGQFPGRWRITSYLQTRKGNRDCEQADFLDPHAPSLPRALKAAGYATAHIGKWHLGGGRDVIDPPKFAAYGYDIGFGTWESPEPHPDITASNWIWSSKDKVSRWDRTQWMVDQTLKFVDAHTDRPCFVNLWLDDTHTPWVPSGDELDGEKVKAGNSEKSFRRVLTEMDRQIGRLLEALRQPGRKRETLVLFLGDNGPLPTFGQTRAGGLRGSKLSLYEGGIRVPCIAWWPGRVPADHVNQSTVFSAVDFFPTLCGVADAAVPEGYASDGENLSSALFGATPKRSRPLFWEYGRNATSFAYPQDAMHRSPAIAVREGAWKLLVNADNTGMQLFDIEADRNETKDIAAENPDVATRLSQLALSWRKSLPPAPVQ